MTLHNIISDGCDDTIVTHPAALGVVSRDGAVMAKRRVAPRVRDSANGRQWTSPILAAELHGSPTGGIAVVCTRERAERLHHSGDRYQITILTGRRLATGGQNWVSKRSDRDFTLDEQDLADHLRPILMALDVAGAIAAPTTTASEESERVRLTDRELEVLRFVDQGLTAIAIGHALRISDKTVRKHLQNVYQKLGIHDRLMAVARARQLGLFAAPSPL